VKNTTNFRHLLKTISRSGAAEVLRSLEKTEDFNEILKMAKVDRGATYKIIQSLAKLGLVEDIYDYTLKRHRYRITPIGLKIAEKLEELEQIWEEYQKSGLPKERKKFLKKDD